MAQCLSSVGLVLGVFIIIYNVWCEVRGWAGEVVLSSETCNRNMQAQDVKICKAFRKFCSACRKF